MEKSKRIHSEKKTGFFFATLFILICITLFFALTPISASAASSTSVHGDVNSDGSVTLDDVIMIKQYIAGIIELTDAQKRSADVYGADGDVNLDDAIRMEQFLAYMDVEFDNSSNTCTGDHLFSERVVHGAYLVNRATCESAAVYRYSCVCGAFGTETFQDGEALGHDYGDWTFENDSHKRVCKNDSSHIETAACSGGTATCEAPATCDTCGHEYGNALGHSYGEWEIIQNPTCTTIGTKTAKCTHGECGDTKTEDVPATGHSYTDVITAPTCTTQGYTTHTCSCGDVVIDTYVNATEHNWDIDAPTCTQGQYCADCGATTDALGHDYEASSAEATCTSAATVTYTCKRNCGHSYTDTVGTATGHNIKNVAPTLVAVEGEACTFVQHYECTVCHGDVIGETVSHHDKYIATIVTAATCTTEGTKKLTCSACG